MRYDLANVTGKRLRIDIGALKEFFSTKTLKALHRLKVHTKLQAHLQNMVQIRYH